jgi:hypothetical protein
MFSIRNLKRLTPGLAGALLITSALAAEPHEAPIRDFADDTVSGWISDSTVINAVKAQNRRNANLTQAEIDALDKQWRSETKTSNRPLIDRILANEVSGFLKKAKSKSGGLVTEVFVMDNQGLNVGQSDVTSDYWQGDEAKWKNTYLAGPDAVFIDEVEHDESTQTFQSQLSMSIKDPETGEVIGAITVGIDVEALL